MPSAEDLVLEIAHSSDEQLFWVVTLRYGSMVRITGCFLKRVEEIWLAHRLTVVYPLGA
jgi:hypothetical protein